MKMANVCFHFTILDSEIMELMIWKGNNAFCAGPSLPTSLVILHVFLCGGILIQVIHPYPVAFVMGKMNFLLFQLACLFCERTKGYFLLS